MKIFMRVSTQYFALEYSLSIVRIDATFPLCPHTLILKLHASSAPRSQNGACLETLATSIKGMGKDDLCLLEGLVAARQRELM